MDRIDIGLMGIGHGPWAELGLNIYSNGFGNSMRSN